MLRFIDSFDHYQTADISMKWTAVAGAGNPPLVSPATGRNGTRSLKFPVTNQVVTVFKTFDAQASWVVGFAFRAAAPPLAPKTVLQLTDGGTVQVDLRLNTDMTLSVTRNGTAITGGTSVVALASNVYAYVEFKATIAASIGAGSCKVRINGLDVVTVATGQSVQSTGNATANAVHVGPNNNFLDNTGGEWDYDDLYVCDGQGSANTDFLGDVVIQPLYPTGAGATTQWNAVGPSNWQDVSEALQDGDATFNRASSAGLKDTFAVQDLAGTVPTIFGVQWVAALRKDDGSSYVLHRVVRSGGADYEGSAALAPNTTYAFLTEVLENDPATAAPWTQSGVNAAESGIKLVSVT